MGAERESGGSTSGELGKGVRSRSECLKWPAAQAQVREGAKETRLSVPEDDSACKQGDSSAPALAVLAADRCAVRAGTSFGQVFVHELAPVGARLSPSTYPVNLPKLPSAPRFSAASALLGLSKLLYTFSRAQK